MEDIEYSIAYKEILEILKYIPKSDYDKIPSEKIQLFRQMQNKNYDFKYDPLKTLDEQNVSHIAKAIIVLLFRDYWATDVQKQKIIAKQNYERKKIYNYDDIFKKNKHQNVKKEENNIIPNKLPIEYKENIFTKFFNKIKSIFKTK